MTKLLKKCSLVNGIKVYGFKQRSELHTIISDGKKPMILVAVNAEKIINANSELKELINSNIGYPDGIGVVKALKKKGIQTIKIPGCELWLDIISKHPDKKFYIVGGTEDVIQLTLLKLNTEYPDAQIVGWRNGYLRTNTEEEKLIDHIKSSKPDVVFVAMGSPKQEKLIKKLMKEHPAIYQGLGGSLDVYCGKLKRAPFLFQQFGMEWFYRLIKEPIRIKRYFFPLLQFFFKLHLGKL